MVNDGARAAMLQVATGYDAMAVRAEKLDAIPSKPKPL